MNGNYLNFASSFFAAEARSVQKPLLTVLFVRRTKGGGLTYPTGTTEQLQQIHELFVKTLKDAGARFEVELDLQTEPVRSVNASLEHIKKIAPDGLIIVANDLRMWETVNQLVEKRGEVPVVVYSNVSGFIPHYRHLAKFPRTFVAATEEVDYLATAVRMFKTLWDMKNLNLLHCPSQDYYNEYKKVPDSDEVREIADFYIKNATEVVEPKYEQVLAAAKHHITMRRLLEKTGCNGITVTGSLCIGARPPDTNPACLAVSRLLDEGIPAACQRDMDAAKSMRLTLSLTGRPGFMGNVCANTVNNTLILSHCTSALKLEGVSEPFSAPYMLRDYHAMGGVCMMVAWPIGRDVTVVDFLDDTTVSVGEGSIVANTENIPQPPCGGCRTSVDIAVEGIPDILSVDPSRTLHHYCILGRFMRSIVNYCKFAGLKAVGLTGKSELT